MSRALDRQPPGSRRRGGHDKDEAVHLADECPERGSTAATRLRVVPLDAQRPKRVSHATAVAREAESWIIPRRTTKPWMLVASAAAQTRDACRDILDAILDYAVRKRWLPTNPLEVKRTSKSTSRSASCAATTSTTPTKSTGPPHAPSVLEEAFWLFGAHAGLRLPGEAQGLTRGAVDFQAGVIRVHDNWVRNALDTTKTADSEAIPMTPRLTRALEQVMDRDYATGRGLRIRERGPRRPRQRARYASFKLAQRKAALQPIRMYNLRHSFGTTLARSGVDVRTIQALMLHARLTTTEQYMAYAAA